MTKRVCVCCVCFVLCMLCFVESYSPCRSWSFSLGRREQVEICLGELVLPEVVESEAVILTTWTYNIGSR